jgi:fructose-bisphosphate aldolase, class I
MAIVDDISRASHFSMLKQNADFLVQRGKGILAADESPTSTIKRLHSIGLENTAEQRRIYRQILFTTSNIQQYISGVIMHEETFHQSNDSSLPFPAMLAQLGILPGIKLDRVTNTTRISTCSHLTRQGLESLTTRTNETTSLGFDDLDQRCDEL